MKHFVPWVLAATQWWGKATGEVRMPLVGCSVFPLSCGAKHCLPPGIILVTFGGTNGHRVSPQVPAAPF